jgi:UDP-N-acetylglucosamine acyltransferase
MNLIHETAIVEKNVKIGNGNYIGPYCVIKEGVIIGDNNRFEAFVSIGTSPEHRNYFYGSDFSVVVGDSNIFREFVTVNAGTHADTIIGNKVVMLKSSHVGHDCIIEDGVNLSCGALIGGHSHLMKGCNFGLGATCHQNSLIGAFSMIGMNSVVPKDTDIEPGTIYVGSPAKFLKSNAIGLERAGISPEELAQIYQEWMFYNK